MPMDLDEDINDEFRDPYNEGEGCWNCLRARTCEINQYDADGCNFIENRWQNRTPSDFSGHIEYYLKDKGYSHLIHEADCNTVTIYVDELWSFGETVMLTITDQPPSPESDLFPLLLRAHQEIVQNGIDYRNIAITEFQVCADLFLNKPKEMIEITRSVINDMKQDEYSSKVIGIILKNNNDNHLIKNLSKKHMSKLVTVTGVVKIRTEIETYDRVSAFQCKTELSENGEIRECNRIRMVPQNTEKTVLEPLQCTEHNAKSRWVHLPGRSIRGNIQYFKIQETNYDKKPREIVIRARDFTIERIEIGDVVQVTGIWSGHLKEKRGEYESYLNCTGIDRQEFLRQVTEIDQDRREELLQKIADPNYFENIRISFAPNVEGYDEAKMALFLQQINSNDIIKSGGIPNRGTIHILFCGDPGTAKTELANYVLQVAPRCGKITGKRATVAGLTMTATNTDKEFGKSGWAIEGGGLVMHDEGTLIIDEVHQMSKEAQDCLNDPLEDMRCSGVLAGVEATFKTRTCVLALANPHYGYFVEEKQSHLAEQFKISPPLFSRFDGIIITRADWNDLEKTNRIMDLMLQDYNFHQPNNGHEKPLVKEDFQDIIAMARTITTALTDETRQLLKDYMFGMLGRIRTKVNEAKEDGIEKPRFTMRLMNSLRRFSMASARARLSPTVQPQDCENAYRVMISWLDPLYKSESGYNFSRLEFPEDRKPYSYDDVLKFLDGLTHHGRDGFLREDLMYYIKNKGSNWQEMGRKFLEMAIDNGLVTKWGNKYRLVLN